MVLCAWRQRCATCTVGAKCEACESIHHCGCQTLHAAKLHDTVYTTLIRCLLNLNFAAHLFCFGQAWPKPHIGQHVSPQRLLGLHKHTDADQGCALAASDGKACIKQLLADLAKPLDEVLPGCARHA